MPESEVWLPWVYVVGLNGWRCPFAWRSNGHRAEGDRELIQIFVTTLAGSTVAVEVATCETIGHVKREVVGKTGVPANVPGPCESSPHGGVCRLCDAARTGTSASALACIAAASALRSAVQTIARSVCQALRRIRGANELSDRNQQAYQHKGGIQFF